MRVKVCICVRLLCICKYVCVFMYLCVYMYVYIHVYVYYECVSTYAYTNECLCGWVGGGGCEMYLVSSFACGCVNVHICIYVNIHAHTSFADATSRECRPARALV